MIFRLRIILPVLFSAAVLMLLGAGTAVAGTMLGDADGDGAVTIKDVTCIQRALAELPVSGGISEAAADIDGNGVVDIADATLLQMWLAEIETPYPIGVQAVDPTVPSTQSPTDEEGWGREIFQP